MPSSLASVPSNSFSSRYCSAFFLSSKSFARCCYSARTQSISLATCCSAILTSRASFSACSFFWWMESRLDLDEAIDSLGAVFYLPVCLKHSDSFRSFIHDSQLDGVFSRLMLTIRFGGPNVVWRQLKSLPVRFFTLLHSNTTHN